MIDFTTLQGLTIPEGVVTQITDESGRVIWAVASGEPIVLEVQKSINTTYAGDTSYPDEEFIALNIYPKKKGTVKVTYCGLTKTITDTSGAINPNAQTVFFGTYNGVTDDVATPASGELTIEGDYRAFGNGSFKNSKNAALYGNCIKRVISWGEGITYIPNNAFSKCTDMTDLTFPNTITEIGQYAFDGCESLEVTFLGTIPPKLGEGVFRSSLGTYVSRIIVPKGCGEAYKTAETWEDYTDLIVEAS